MMEGKHTCHEVSKVHLGMRLSHTNHGLEVTHRHRDTATALHGISNEFMMRDGEFDA
jgi:hypothetical protein